MHTIKRCSNACIMSSSLIDKERYGRTPACKECHFAAPGCARSRAVGEPPGLLVGTTFLGILIHRQGLKVSGNA